MCKKVLFAALAALMILTLLSGCQLAVDDKKAGEDTLCGVFVTLDYLETDLSEETIELPLGWNGDPNSIVFPETRIYATRHEDEYGSADYTFDGIEGYRLFSITEMNPFGKESYKATIANGLQDVHSSYSTTDAGEEIGLTGTILFDIHFPCHVYANPVYQTPDGQVYMTQGQGLWFDELQSEGAAGSTKLSATSTKIVDSKKTSDTINVELKIEGLNTNEKIVLKQMDSSDQIIAQTEITQDNIPDSIILNRQTAYMIMEEHCIDYESKTVVKRTLLNTDEEYFNVRFTGNNGIVEAFSVTLEES